MTLKTEIIGGVIILLVTFAAGRYSVQAPTVKTTIQESAKVDTDLNKDTHKKTVSVTVKLPSGTTKTTTTVTEDTISDKRVDSEKLSSVTQTITPPKTGTINVSALAGISLVNGQPVYGASASKEFIGPLTIGVFGLTNGVLGASIGVNL